MRGAEGLEGEYRERVMRAVRYIEANLASPLSLEDAAAEASWSLFHFHRVFRALLGIGPGEYLRGRRLSEAARLLSSGEARIASIARETGFGSPEAFCRSFKASFGLSPGEYREASAELALMNPFGPNERPLVLRATCLEGEPRVEEYGPIRLVAARGRFDVEDGSIGESLRAFWEENAGLLEVASGRERGGGLRRSYGIAEAEPGNEGSGILYFAAVEAPEADDGQALAAGLVEYSIPRASYLLARHRGGLGLLNETYLYLYGSWLPRAGLRPAAAMDFDFYGEAFDRVNPESPESLVEFRIPVTPLG